MDAVLTPARDVTIRLAATVTGLTERAIEAKIREGVWLGGQEYNRGPDGRIYIDLHAVSRWIRSR
jgi:hypothetical protein